MMLSKNRFAQYNRISAGLRPHHYGEWKLQTQFPRYFEVLIDNYMYQDGGPSLGHLEYFSQKAELLFHGVGLDVCGVDPISEYYLKSLKNLCERFQPKIVSDHLCFNRAGGHQSYDLLPFAYNEVSLKRTIERIDLIQTYLGRRIALENLSSYVSFKTSTMSEFEFMTKLHESSGVTFLLDVNNLFVNSQNFDFDPLLEMRNLPKSSVVQFHVAGHCVLPEFLHDTHDQDVRSEVWQLLAQALQRFGIAPVILERDDEGSPLEVLLNDMHRGELFLTGSLEKSSEDTNLGRMVHIKAIDNGA